MKSSRRMLSAFLASAVLLGAFPAAYAVEQDAYQDIQGHWAQDVINEWSDKQIINGYNGYFEPDASMTRADVAVVIDRIMDYQDEAENTFSDLGNAYYTDALLRVAEQGVMQGDDGQIRPLDPITREEIVCVLQRAFDIDVAEEQPGFADNNAISSWAQASVAAFEENGFVSGKPGNLFDPQAEVTRAEVVQMLDNLAASALTDLRVTVADEETDQMVHVRQPFLLSGCDLDAEVPVGTASVDIYPTAEQGASITVDGETLRNGKATVQLDNGFKLVEISVSNGAGTQSYELVVRIGIDPQNPYQTLYAGEHEQTVTLDNGEVRSFTAYVPEGARESNAGVFVIPDRSGAASTFEEWKQLADQTDTQTIDDDWIKQQEKFIVICLDGLTYGTSAEARAADIDYVNKVYTAACGRGMYCIHEAKNYMVGYGMGGTIAQMAAMDQTAVWAGLVTVGAGEIDDSWLAEHNTEMAVSLNGYTDEDSSIPKNTIPLPVWIINDGTETDPDTLSYWMAANHIEENDAASDSGITKYVRSVGWTADEQMYGENRDTEAYRIWVSNGTQTASEIWNDFLFDVRRWMADPGGDLRMTEDPIADLGMERRYEEVGGWMREWYTYVPDSVNASTQDVPVVFALHGYSLNGGVYAGQTDWHEVADEEGFIVIYPSAIYDNIKWNGNAPLPAWSIRCDETLPDDVAFIQFLLEDVDASYDIDLGRVYVTGHSWGSQMSHVMALSNPEMFAAAAPLSGFIFRTEVYDSLDSAAMERAGGIPVYMSAGTEGSTEASICPVPPTRDNWTGQSIEQWFAINGCDGSIDWADVSAVWTDSPAYEQEGRWYTLTYEKDGVPMLCAEIVDYMPHATMPEHSERVWDNWFSHYSRDDAGKLIYSE